MVILKFCAEHVSELGSLATDCLGQFRTGVRGPVDAHDAPVVAFEFERVTGPTCAQPGPAFA